MADNKISKYLNTYNEGEFLSPDDVRRGQDFIKANIPLGLGLAPILPTTQQTEMTSPVSTNQNPIIRNAGIFLEPTQPKQLSLSPMSQSTSKQQDDDSGRFLASLIAQGAAGFGTGISGGSAADIQRSAGAFQTMRDTQENQRRAKLLTDPNSEESKKKREVYKSLGYQVPNNLSATDLNDPTVLQTLKTQMQEQKLAAMPRGGIGVGGVGKVKEEKESKNQSDINKYTAEADSLRNQLIEYKKAVKAIPILGGAAQKANAEALQKDILLTIKNIKKTGSLDEGSIKVIEGMIGTADYTRGDIVDATINRSLQNLNKAVETELRGTGTKNTKYTPYIPYENPTPQEEEIIKNYYSDPNDPDNLKMYQTLRAKKGF